MTPKNRKSLDHRVRMAAQAVLSKQKYVSSIDVLIGVGWLDSAAVTSWRKGQVDYLERVVNANLSRISEAMKMFRAWAVARNLVASETRYVRHTRGGRPPLRFSKSGHPSIEKQYRTHWVLRQLSEKEESSGLVAIGGGAPKCASVGHDRVDGQR
jgi:hypothetical protein